FLLIAGDHGTLKIYANGEYVYTYNNTYFAGQYTDQFHYTIVDFEGDKSTTTLTINITSTGPGNPPLVERTIDESDDTGNDIGGFLNVPGATSFDLTGGSATGSLPGNVLSSNGVPVVITQDGDDYVGMAGNVEVFRLVLDPQTGEYTFTQY